MKISLFLTLTLCAFAIAAPAQKLSKEEIAKRVAAATPKAFTGPKMKRPVSDASLEGIKGPVRSVREYLAEGTGKSQLIQETFFDEAGDLTRAIDYRDGLPVYVSVYGWVDGKRVSRSGEVRYSAAENAGPLKVITSVEAAELDRARPRDARYDMQYVRKFDDQGRLLEDQKIDSAGRTTVRVVYSYEGGMRIERDVNDLGGLIARSDKTLDAAGNPTRRIMYDEDGKPNYVETSVYEYDRRGSWTKRTTYGEDLPSGERGREVVSVTRREITYY